MSFPNIVIDAGPHERRDCPLQFQLPQPLPSGAWVLAGDTGSRFPLQVDSAGQAVCVLPQMDAGAVHTLRIEPADANAGQIAVQLDNESNGIAIKLHGELVTRYVYSDVPARPYFYPVYAPGQIPVTRSYPMIPDAPGEARDHPHHRSVWIAFGEVNGADNWSEESGHGYTRHEKFDEISSGAVAGTFASTSLWTGADGTPLLTERLRVTTWAAGDTLRLVDFDIRLEATRGDVHFGDTKEGGILSLRVASELDVPRTGRITNVYGGINEAETWGKSSHWCDYSGRVEGNPVGISVFDHPSSFRHPTHWNVRNYGLMTANPFAYAAYTNGAREGSHTLRSGDALSFHYRLVLHKEDCQSAQVAVRYVDFVAPPRVTVST